MYYKISYQSSKIVGTIPANYPFWFWIDAVFAEPEETVFEEGEEDGEKNFYPTFQKSTKTYNLETSLVPESVIDAITRMKYFDTKTITLPDGTVYNMNNVKTAVNYPFSEKCYGIVTITFDINEVIVLTGC